MAEMVDDETIYSDFAENLSDEEIAIVKKVLILWADALDKLPENERSIKIVFSACVNTIGTMGPAYCHIASTTLLHHAEQDEEYYERTHTT